MWRLIVHVAIVHGGQVGVVLIPSTVAVVNGDLVAGAGKHNWAVIQIVSSRTSHGIALWFYA